MSIELGICNDQLTILRESHAERELITCGKNTTLEWEDRDLAAPANGEEFDRLQVKFYSSRECHNCGFFMFAFCINQANTYDQPGCVQNIPTFGKRDTESEASSMVSPLLSVCNSSIVIIIKLVPTLICILIHIVLAPCREIYGLILADAATPLDHILL